MKIISLVCFWMLIAVGWAQQCTPVFPAFEEGRNYSAFGEGRQLLFPSHQFSCSGIVTGMSAQVIGEGASGIDFQIWRPKSNGMYELVWGRDSRLVRDPDTNTISIEPLIREIPVRAKDVIGLFLADVDVGEDFIGVQYENGTDTAGTVFYVEGTGPLCNFSLCDANVHNMTNTSPFVNVVFQPMSDLQTQEILLSQAGTHDRCTTTGFSSCSMPSTGVIPMPAPTILPVAPIETSNDATLPSMQTTPPPQFAEMSPSPSPPLEDVNLGDDIPKGGVIKLRVETIAVIVIGIILLIILIILVTVLVACIFHKRATFKLVMRAADVDSIGGLTVSTHLGLSVEHSHQSLATINGIGVQDGLVPAGTAEVTAREHCYVNTCVDNILNGRPPSSSSHNEVQDRLCMSTGAPQNDYHARPPRRHTTATCSDRPVARKPSQHSIIDKSESDLETSTSSVSTRDKSLHYYSVPEAPFLSMLSPNYDRLEELPEPEQTKGFRRYDRLSVPPEIEAGCRRSERSQFGQEEPDTAMAQQVAEQLMYAYVPTEEQRRLLHLHKNGRYETADDIPAVRGYDKLKFFEEVDIYWAPAATTSDLYSQLYDKKYREIPRSQIRILKQIGSGHFGTVSKGEWQVYPRGGALEVAVKTVKADTETERIRLLQEAAIMGQFAHSKVVRLHGMVTMGEPFLMVLEYMVRGDLRSFLQKLHPKNDKKELPDGLPKQFIKFSKDIAEGMSYLARKCFVHRDLAARNILLTQDLTCKIGDFGMARDIESESDYYRSQGGIIPVKWTAPEALNYNKYTSASDVWSFGMVLYEIWSVGEKPFSDLTNPIVIALVNGRHCQPPPPGCPRPIYHLMIECWNPIYSQRPSFDSIHDYLDSPPDSLLQWRQQDVIAGKQAHVLGAALLEANNLYYDLQRTYQNKARDRTP